MPYNDAFIDIAMSDLRIKRSWFANYKLLPGNQGYGYKHILRNHALEHDWTKPLTEVEYNRLKNKDIFKEKGEIRNLIDEVLTSGMDKAYAYQSRGKIVVEYNFHRTIGFSFHPHPVTGKPVRVATPYLRIIMRRDGSITSAFPASKEVYVQKLK